MWGPLPPGANVQSMTKWSVLAADLGASLFFVLLGLHAHHHGIGDIAAVWGPFAAGVIVANVALVRWVTPLTSGRAGVVGALVTVACAMALRATFSQGVVPVFVLVATVFLGMFFSAWRFAVRHWTKGSRPSSH
jgi:hypothetical protein